MDIALLEDFLALADELNFSAAANRRNMTQPAFSRRIKALEEWVGVPLLRRTSRSVSLTDEGRAFRPRAAAIARDLKRAREEALESAGKSERSLTIAATHALSFTFVPKWMLNTVGHANFGSVNLVSDNYNECEAMLLRGDAVFLVCHSRRELKDRLSGRQFVRHDIGKDILIPVTALDAEGAPQWTLSSGATEASIPHLAYSSPSGIGRILEGVWQNSESKPALRTKFRSHLAATLLEMVKQGTGVAWVPMSLAERDLTSGVLGRAGGKEYDVAIDISIIRPSARLSTYAERFWHGISSQA